MIFRKPGESKGIMALIYGETGVGKTVSTLDTCPKPCLYVEIDPKPVERTGGGIVNFENIDIAHPENFIDLFTYINEQADEVVKRYKSVVIDPFSFLVNVVLLGDLEDETARAEVFGNKRPLMNMGRTDLSGYGSLASLAKRLCKALGLLAVRGVNVICISLLDEAPKWNRELVAAPAFAGKEFNRDYPAYFDCIGLVQRREEGGEIVYPPVVIFDSPDESFVHKWSGQRKGRTVKGTLDWRKILRVSKKEKGDEGSN
ncbi:MAG TPA: AAA family ATPase [Mesotoga sp.]|nr:AAA family ATPase [Mesotoga sp.]HRU78406.1 AAA family ATPase [Rectinema sp.]